MKWIFGVALMFLAGTAEAGTYRGLVAVEKVLAERLLDGDLAFSFTPYFAKNASERAAAGNLFFLMGQYASRGGNEFRNGTPNSISMLLWQMALRFTADETKHYCAGDRSLPFHPYFRATLDGVCRWPAREAKSEETLRGFWLAVMGADAPEEEYLAWREFALSSSVAEKPALEAVPELFFAIVYNPYFLLRQ